jgi:hypothetical protein
MGANMKRTFYFLLTTVLGFALASVAAAQSQNQSLGDYARAVKKTKPSPTGKAVPKVYDNENLPAGATLSVVGTPSATDSEDKTDQPHTKDTNADGKAADTTKADAKTVEASDKKQEVQLKPGQSAQDRDKAIEAFKNKLDDQKDKISLLSRELDVLQREYQLKVSEFYSDTAARVQNPNGLADVDAKYKQQIADKQKAVDEAKAALSNIQEEGRRSGAPNSVLEQ